MLGLGAGGERGERDLGDLGVGHPLLELLVEDRLRVADRPSTPSSGIAAIAAVTAGSFRAVMENRAPARRAAAITSWP